MSLRSVGVVATTIALTGAVVIGGSATPARAAITAASTTTTIVDPRATGSRPSFAPKVPGALPRPVISRGVVGDPAAVLAADLLTRTGLGQTGAATDAVRGQLAAVVAARIKTATAAELDAAWARTTPVRLKVVLTGLAQVGIRYTWNSASPAAGFDCSGLVLYAWSAAGVALPHQSEAQVAVARAVTQAQLQPGDITHYPNHVTLYLGAGRAIVEAEQSGVPVKVDDWSDSVQTFGSPLPS